MDQMSLFDGEENKKLKIIEGDGWEFIPDGHKVFYSQFLGTGYESVENLFMGFNEIRAITFSYDIKFIDKIMKMFDYGELILGGRFMVRRDDELHKLVGEAYSLLEAMTLSESAADAIRGQKDLVARMSQQDLFVRSPKLLIDHRKLYLLKADDGRTRVVKGSANMTGTAWSGNQMESYEVDDSKEGYEAYLEDFESAWELSSNIPEDVVVNKKSDKPENDIPLIKEALKTREAIVLRRKIQTRKAMIGLGIQSKLIRY